MNLGGDSVSPVIVEQQPPAGLLVKTVVFTQAQLLAAFTAPNASIQVLPAPGANAFYEVVAAAYSINWTNAPAGTVSLSGLIGTFVGSFFSLTNWYQGAVTGRRAGSLMASQFNLTPAQTAQVANGALVLSASAALPALAAITSGGFKFDVAYRVHQLV